MFPFAHFMIGSLGMYFLKRDKRGLLMFLISGLFGIMSDVDIIFNGTFLGHRGIFHTLIPFALVVGIVSYLVAGSFMFGFWGPATHFLLDYIDAGSVAIVPGYLVDLGINWPEDNTRIYVSSVIGCIVCCLVIWVEKIDAINDKKEGKNEI